MIPLLFGIQQLVEGLIWLTYRHVLSPEWRPPLVLLFLTYAQIIWPVWVPLAIRRLEPQPVRRKMLNGLLAAGAVFSLYLTYCLFRYPVTVIVDNHHLSYQLQFPDIAGRLDAMVYCLCTIVSPFISSVRNMRLVGLAILVSFLAAALFYRDTIISVWCYFAALISVTVLVVLHQSEKSSEWNRDQGMPA